MASLEGRSRAIFARYGASVRRRLAGGREFELAYLRSGPPSACPVLVIPGGPGLSSLTPYAGLRAAAVRRGMDLLMVEHRGVGMSRRDTTGADLLVSDVTGVAAVDDLVAVLDAEGITFLMEPDLVSGIAYGELGYGLPVDDGPLDPQLLFADAATRMPVFRGMPVDLRRAATEYAVPTVVISGERDLRTPRPVAQRIVQLVPDAVLAPATDLGHSALDNHPLLALALAHAAGSGRAHLIPGRMSGLERLPRRGASNALGALLRAAGALAATP